MAGSSGEPDLFHHVLDSDTFEFFPTWFGEAGIIHLPSFPVPWGQFQITKFMVLELVAAVLIVAIYVPLARRIAAGEAPKGGWWNGFETLLTFIRDFVAKPSLRAPHHEEGHGHEPGHGEHARHAPADPDAEVDRYVPYLWTVFLFILFCNLLGMIPLLGSPTAAPAVTATLAVFSFLLFHGAASMKMGFMGYMSSIWPKIDMPVALGIWVKPMIFVIELLGTFIKSFVLAVRLFANLFAGHLVLSVILLFITMANNVALGPIGWTGVTIASVLGVTALSLLELFVAFLQAFIFTFLTALFLGMAINPQH
jgi:F-type H+-transporting ATPase subunit a